MRILVVDDSRDVVDTYRDVLQAEGHDVATARSGSEALKLAAERPFDLVLTDVMMPGMSGLDLITRLRSDFAVPPQIIAVSGFPEIGDEATQRGARLFLTKPVTLADLTACVLEAGRGEGEPRVRFDEVQARTEASRSLVCAAAESALGELRDRPAIMGRQKYVAKWIGALLEGMCVMFFVIDQKVRIVATTAPDEYPVDGGPVGLIRVAADVIQAGSSLHLAGDSIRRALDLPTEFLIAAPLRYQQQAVGAVFVIRGRGRAFETADLRTLEMIADLGSKGISGGGERLFEDNHLLTRQSFERLVGAVASRTDPDRTLTLGIVRTRVELGHVQVPIDDALFSEPETTLAQLDDRNIGLLLYDRRPVEVVHKRVSALIQQIDERWGQAAAAVAVYVVPPRHVSGRRIVQGLFDLIESMPPEPQRATRWMEQSVKTLEAPSPS